MGRGGKTHQHNTFQQNPAWRWLQYVVCRMLFLLFFKTWFIGFIWGAPFWWRELPGTIWRNKSLAGEETTSRIIEIKSNYSNPQRPVAFPNNKMEKTLFVFPNLNSVLRILIRREYFQTGSFMYILFMDLASWILLIQLAFNASK